MTIANWTFGAAAVGRMVEWEGNGCFAGALGATVGMGIVSTSYQHDRETVFEVSALELKAIRILGVVDLVS